MRKKLLLGIVAITLFLGNITPTCITYAAKTTESQDTKKVLLCDTTSKTEESEASYEETTLVVKEDSFVADTFQGVDALYRPGKTDGTSATYSCAAFVKKYYKEQYDLSLYHLSGGSTPLTYEGDTFESVKTPKIGDIAATNSHWAIVKSVDKENETVVLIEQNWKWQQGGQTMCKINRTISFKSLTFYRLND
ncbi:MAG: hypothetical protein ACERKN_22050 [Velocimicrobium sp.]